MKVWQSSYGNIIGIRSESPEEECIIENFVFLKKLEGVQIHFASNQEFIPPQTPCPDCGWDGRHHT
jgi:hypothetical protein